MERYPFLVVGLAGGIAGEGIAILLLFALAGRPGRMATPPRAL
jgi:hypothetical protein